MTISASKLVFSPQASQVLTSFGQENPIEEDTNQNCEFEVEDEGGGEGWHEEVWRIFSWHHQYMLSLPLGGDPWAGHWERRQWGWRQWWRRRTTWPHILPICGPWQVTNISISKITIFLFVTGRIDKMESYEGKWNIIVFQGKFIYALSYFKLSQLSFCGRNSIKLNGWRNSHFETSWRKAWKEQENSHLLSRFESNIIIYLNYKFESIILISFFWLALISLGSCSGALLDITHNNKLIH